MALKIAGIREGLHGTLQGGVRGIGGEGARGELIEPAFAQGVVNDIGNDFWTRQVSTAQIFELTATTLIAEHLLQAFNIEGVDQGRTKAVEFIPVEVSGLSHRTILRR